VYYSVRDPQLFQLLDVAREIFNNHLIDLQAMLETESYQETADQVDGHRHGHQAKGRRGRIVAMDTQPQDR
jgi:hypothetical protein